MIALRIITVDATWAYCLFVLELIEESYSVIFIVLYSDFYTYCKYSRYLWQKVIVFA